MTDQHPITPPPELIAKWASSMCGYVEAAQWGYNQAIKELEAFLEKEMTDTEFDQQIADQELEACCEWVNSVAKLPITADSLRIARRPKPPSLNSIALQMLDTIECDGHYIPEITDTLRRALEQLDD